jgi:uncharacterized membrane protein YbhN (UPF0104 family)
VIWPLHSLDAVADRLAALDGRWLALALALQLANLGLRALALRNVLAAAYPRMRVRLLDVGAAYAAGVALNAYVPARGGEALKVAIIRLRIPESSVATIAASSGVILVFDAVMGVALLATGWWLGVVPALPQPSLLAVSLVLAVVVLGASVLVALPRLRARMAEGLAILATPRQYLRRVVPVQLGAWACRLGVAYAVLAAFHLPATVPLAALVVLAGGVSTLVPTPGGAGVQQLLVVYALKQSASAASALSFSIGMQVGVTVVNSLVGLAALAFVFQTLRPSTIRAAIGDTRSAGA